MVDLDYQIKISSALSELLDFSEIYCSAACCGLSAFEIHKGLLLRKIIDKNISGESGINWYNELKIEIDYLHGYVTNLVIENEKEIPVIYPRNDKLPEYYLPKNELQHLLLRWQRVFKQVKGTQAVP